MYKRCFNQALIEFLIQPEGPILVKASESQADLGRPDMAFIRTRRGGAETVYLPGSSLKGVLRAHCEQVVRGLGDTDAGERPGVWSCDPLDDDHSCSGQVGDKKLPAEQAYREACFICRMFGHTNLAGRVRTSDAYPEDEVHIESRDGVAINRFYGSVEVGPFTYEVAVGGSFHTRLLVRNFTLPQLGLLALALHDLKRGRVSIGYGKGRGLGRVTAHVEKFIVRYPACELDDKNEKLYLLGHAEPVAGSEQLAGVGAFVASGVDGDYRTLPDGLRMDTDDWGEVWLELMDEAQIERVWAKTCVPAWRTVAGLKGEEADYE